MVIFFFPSRKIPFALEDEGFPKVLCYFSEIWSNEALPIKFNLILYCSDLVAVLESPKG